VIPAAGACPEVWIMGSTAGNSARVAGRNGLRFVASYHVSPSTTLDAIDAYRAAFQPSEYLDQPYVGVSADVVVGPDEATARRLAAGYGPWVYSARIARGVIEYPTPDEAAAFHWDDDGRQLVADRVSTQFVGDPETVADQLEILRKATDADELVVTTITHDHADRVQSYQLLAEEWQRRDLS
jgi:luciferase family oxidoreductase group 1